MGVATGMHTVSQYFSAPRGTMFRISGSASLSLNRNANYTYADHAWDGSTLTPLTLGTKPAVYFQVYRSTDTYFSQNIVKKYPTNDVYQLYAYFECSDSITLAQKVITVNTSNLSWTD